jgi:bifunctional DNA-binding transcriptional regulator/antitoxin component of YhaV-PrlF toxin-antitoxin module
VITNGLPLPVVFKVKLGRTGHSLKVTLPRPIIDGFGWKEGDEMVLVVTDRDITLKRNPDA